MNTHKHLNIICVLLLLCGMLFLLTSCGEIPLQTYDEIIDEFRTMLTEEPARGSTAEQTADPIRTALAEVAARCEDVSVMAYSLHDINDDGTEELILTETDGTTIHALFTQIDGQAVLLEQFEKGCIIKPDGCLYYIKKNESEQESVYHVVYLIDGKLQGDVYGHKEDGEEFIPFMVENGIRVYLTGEQSKRYSDLIFGHQFHFSANDTKDTCLFTVPLFPTEAPNPAPMLSLATYDDVLTLCRDIVELHLPRKTEYSEHGIDFRTLYTCPDAQTYEMYCRLYSELNRASTGRDYYRGDIGYSLYDLNDDGTDELILMLEDYTILAILTLRDNLPVLLSTTAAVINENGYFNATQLAPDNKETTRYCLWDIANGNLRTLICVQYRYSQKMEKRITESVDRGQKIAISYEEFLSLCEQTDLTPTGFSDREYTRAASGLIFTPLLPSEPAVLDAVMPIIRDPNMISSTVNLTQTDSHTWETEFYFFAPNDSNEDNHIPITTVITEENATYRFDSNSVRGRIEPIQGGFWLIPEEIADSSIVNKPYLYFYNEQ